MPNDLRPIGIEDLERIAINDKNELFWDGKRVEISRRLSLSTMQKIVAIAVSTFAILGATGGFVTGFNNATVFLCARGSAALTCPTVHPFNG